MKPWENEPNSLDWSHAGVRCEIRRHPSLLHLCGYVVVPPGHPWWGRDYDAVMLEDGVRTHGGLTYARANYSGEWCLGFDCGHFGDLSPGLVDAIPFVNMLERMLAPFGSVYGVYRDLRYVRLEAEALARQAREARGRKANKRRNRYRRQARLDAKAHRGGHMRWMGEGRARLRAEEQDR